ncbi:hypothetical protein [Pelomonas cellulosilytica]|uniref:Uncharacterized protein n=1 Tax=Pelomonas cellulosilytica TaxID=2906762 RepID=A0ABS8XST1_9BURK|nr:hypothetical protein [Pelomonas sp. P8]MCE4553671.1 hypothetical protein [Pelomonas sp. P8]
MAVATAFKPRFWLQAVDGTWYPAPWWANNFPLFDAFADPSSAHAEQDARAFELRQIVARGGLVRTTEPDADHPVTEPVRAVYARAGIAHLLPR